MLALGSRRFYLQGLTDAEMHKSMDKECEQKKKNQERNSFLVNDLILTFKPKKVIIKEICRVGKRSL